MCHLTSTLATAEYINYDNIQLLNDNKNRYMTFIMRLVIGTCWIFFLYKFEDVVLNSSYSSKQKTKFTVQCLSFNGYCDKEEGEVNPTCQLNAAAVRTRLGL